MRVLVSVSMALALMSAPALAADTAADPKDKRICKRSDAGRTGSNLSRPSKVCMKASEWRELEANTERDLRTAREAGGPVGSERTSPAGGPSPN
jgi:hypothetical protein